jgi:hypothetical protein
MALLVVARAAQLGTEILVAEHFGEARENLQVLVG